MILNIPVDFILFALTLLGVALLSKHFEDSKVPAVLPKYLPSDWKGAFVLLVMVFVLPSFLDNIAAAMMPSQLLQEDHQDAGFVGAQ